MVSMQGLLATVALLMGIFLMGGDADMMIEPAKENHNKVLQMVHIVMRHGIRTPVTTYPKDPYINFDFPPNGWGRLTLDGIKGLHMLGKEFRQRYGRFLGHKYNASEYYAQATGVDRAIASIMSVNSGLWEPVDRVQRWCKHLNWYPVPVYSTPLDDDDLLLVRRDCPQYNIEIERVRKSEPIQNKLNKYKELFEYVEKHSGQSMKTFADIEDIFTTLLAESRYGVKLPEWTEGYFPEPMQSAAANSYVVQAYNDKLQRLKGGVLLKKLLNDMKKKRAGSNAQKMYLYGGHDTTVSNLLSTLKVFDPQVPNYAMTVFLELYSDTAQKEYSLEVYVKNSTLPRVQLQLPNCEKACPLDKVIELSKNVLPTDWVKECESDDPNYTTPPPKGP